MKRGRRLTRGEKILLAKQGFDPKCFLRLKKTTEHYVFIKVDSQEIITLRR